MSSEEEDEKFILSAWMAKEGIIPVTLDSNAIDFTVYSAIGWSTYIGDRFNSNLEYMSKLSSQKASAQYLQELEFQRMDQLAKDKLKQQEINRFSAQKERIAQEKYDIAIRINAKSYEILQSNYPEDPPLILIKEPPQYERLIRDEQERIALDIVNFVCDCQDQIFGIGLSNNLDNYLKQNIWKWAEYKHKVIKEVSLKSSIYKVCDYYPFPSDTAQQQYFRILAARLFHEELENLNNREKLEISHEYVKSALNGPQELLKKFLFNGDKELKPLVVLAAEQQGLSVPRNIVPTMEQKSLLGLFPIINQNPETYNGKNCGFPESQQAYVINKKTNEFSNIFNGLKQNDSCLKKVSSIKIGDVIISWDFINQNYFYNYVLEVHTYPKQPIYEIEFSHPQKTNNISNLKVAADQLLWTNKGFVQAKNLTKEHILVLINYWGSRVNSVLQTGEKENIYNIQGESFQTNFCIPNAIAMGYKPQSLWKKITQR